MDIKKWLKNDIDFFNWKKSLHKLTKTRKKSILYYFIIYYQRF